MEPKAEGSGKPRGCRSAIDNRKSAIYPSAPTFSAGSGRGRGRRLGAFDEVVDGVVGGVEGRGQVVVALHEQDLKVGIDGHGLAQTAGGGRKTVDPLPP